MPSEASVAEQRIRLFGLVARPLGLLYTSDTMSKGIPEDKRLGAAVARIRLLQRVLSGSEAAAASIAAVQSLFSHQDSPNPNLNRLIRRVINALKNSNGSAAASAATSSSNGHSSEMLIETRSDDGGLGGN
jgi:hypothetical protein